MTRAGLIEELAKGSNLTTKESEAIVHTVFDRITAALAKGDKVEFGASGASGFTTGTPGRDGTRRPAGASVFPRSASRSSK